MTIVASVKVRDGLILGTDSMTQISVDTPEGPQLLKTYSNARKLFQIIDRPIAVATFGLGNLGQRSIEGVVLDFCGTDEALAATTHEVAQGLYEFVAPLYEAVFQGVNEDARPLLGFYLAGYSEGAPFPEEFEFMLPRDLDPIPARAADQFGTSWRGIDMPFTRLYKGWDPRIRERLSASGMNENDIQGLLDDLETPVIYDGMPVQDAINFCTYILDTTIGWTTYHIGAPSCGYPLQVATILADVGFEWIAQLELQLERYYN